MDIDKELQILKNRIEEARKIKTRAEIQRDNARITVDKVINRLKNEFGVDSLEDAENLRIKLETVLKEKMNSISAELDAFE